MSVHVKCIISSKALRNNIELWVSSHNLVCLKHCPVTCRRGREEMAQRKAEEKARREEEARLQGVERKRREEEEKRAEEEKQQKLAEERAQKESEEAERLQKQVVFCCSRTFTGGIAKKRGCLFSCIVMFVFISKVIFSTVDSLSRFLFL